MSILDIQHWRHLPGIAPEALSIDEIFQIINEVTIWIVYEKHLNEVKGLCAIYGKKPRIYEVANRNIVYFSPGTRSYFFIYPYNPSKYLTLRPTKYLAREITF